MRIALNLASRPYVDLGPLYLRLRVLLVALALLALPLWLLLGAEKQKAAQAHARLAAVENNITRLDDQQRLFQANMRQPRNAAVLRQAQFLNAIFLHKAFSWTAVMMDLENVLPAGVQVQNIDPAVTRGGGVAIHLRVSGQRDRAVDLVRNLEHSQRFLFPRLEGESAESPSQGASLEQISDNGVNFDLLADYNPLPPPGENKHPSANRKAPEKNATHRASQHRPSAQHKRGTL
jgi:type IV pilus assembly protein PilN